ncbi:MAG: SRPBCC domain-containing protein [Planctomycetota bacterium]
MVNRSIERRIRLAATPERLWAAISDPRELSRWVCEGAWLRLEEGSPFRWEWGGGLHADGQIEAFEQGSHLQLSYRVPMFQECVLHPTRIRFDIEPVDDESADLRLRHTRFLDAESWDQYFDGHRRCWDVDLQKLRALIDEFDVGPVLRIAFRLESEAAPEEFRVDLVAQESVESTDNTDGRRSRGFRYEVDRAGRRARVEVRFDSNAVVITEAYEGDDPVHENDAYDHWRKLAANWADGPLDCGTPYDY